MFSIHPDFKRLLFVLAGKTLLILGLILWGNISLSPDEAQYWTWSQQLDWGYYSKPPGIAWQIWLGAQLFGQTELGVRAIALAWSISQSLLVYALAIQAGLSSRSAFWSGVVMALCPIGLIGALLAITDGGCVFFWTLACFRVLKALRQGEEPSPIYVGLCLFAGSLFKWPIYFFWFFFLLSRQLWFPRQSLSKLFLGIGLSLLGLLPSVWWNWTHDWATFRHVSATLQGGHGHSGGNLLEFLGAQLFLLSPILFVLLLLSFREGWRQRRQLPPALLFCGLIPLTCLSAAAALACFQKVQGNWITFTYPTAIVWLVWYARECSIRLNIWLKAGLVFSVALTIPVLMLPWVYTNIENRPLFLSYRLNPFKHLMGWPALQEALAKAGYEPSQHFLAGDKYQTTSLLSFYNRNHQRAYFLNLQGSRRNQFSYWPGLTDEQHGNAGYFVWVENQPHLGREWKAKLSFYQEELPKYFEKVELVGFFPLLFDHSKVSKGAFIFHCSNCCAVPEQASALY